MSAGVPLGLAAEGVADGVPVVAGEGRGLKGRVVVTDPARQAVLFPEPSEALLAELRGRNRSVHPGGNVAPLALRAGPGMVVDGSVDETLR